MHTKIAYMTEQLSINVMFSPSLIPRIFYSKRLFLIIIISLGRHKISSIREISELDYFLSFRFALQKLTKSVFNDIFDSSYFDQNVDFQANQKQNIRVDFLSDPSISCSSRTIKNEIVKNIVAVAALFSFVLKTSLHIR